MATHQSGHDVFISYSHAADRPVAVALQHGLHRLAKPWYRVRALRVFRDDTSLSATPRLWASIEQGLRGSRFFVLVASPESAASRWVAKEVEFRRRRTDPSTFLIVVTDGEVAWDEEAGDFDWEVTTALPRLLAGWFADEPLWVRLDGARRDTALSLRNAEFRAAVCKIASPVHGVAPDDLDSVDIVQHRVANRVRAGAVATLVVLLVVAVVLGLFAVQQRDEAVRQTVAANARALAAEADALADRDPLLSARLSLAAYRLAPSAEQSRQSVLRSLDRNRHGVRHVVQEPALGGAGGHPGEDRGLAGTVALSPDGSVLAVGSRWTGEVRLWDVASGRELGPLGEAPDNSDRFGPSLRFGDDGTTLTVITIGSTETWAVATRQRLSSGEGPPGGPPPAGTEVGSADGSTRVRGDDNGQLFLLGPDSTPVEMLAELPDVISGIALSRDGSVVAAVDVHGNVVTLRPRVDLRFHVLAAAPARADGAEVESPRLTPSPDGRWLLVARAGAAELWRVAERRVLGRFPASGPLDGELVGFSPDGTRFAIRDGDRLVVRESESQRELASEPVGGDPVEVARAFTRQLGGVAVVVDPTGPVTAVGGDRTREVAATIGGGVQVTVPGRSVAVLESAKAGGDRLTSWTSGADLVGDLRVDSALGGLAVSDDGRYVAFDNEVVDVTTGARTPLRGGPGSGAAGNVLAFAAGGDVVLQQVIPSRDYSGGTRLLLWDRASGALIGEFDNHSLTAVDPFLVATGVVGVGADSALAVTDDGAIVLLGTGTDAWARSLCGLVGDLEPDERRDYLSGIDLGPVC